ncbi:MAG: patatin-like phospholipase family protein [Alphaproteobacteria bacterium]|nr:patatin-like phospholipase family protein [Alphaproteobacteria bacterium]
MRQQVKKIALGLQGGGSHGAFTWGVLDALLEDTRIEIIGISGTSAGGMNAAALLQGYNKNGREGARAEMRRFWKLLSARTNLNPFKTNLIQMFTGNHSLRGSPSYAWMNMLRETYSPYDLNPMDINPLRDLVHDFFDCSLLHQPSKLKLFLCATHVKSGKLHIFKGKKITEEALLASACLPNIFKAVEIDGEHYWDGGYVGNPALFPLIYNCPTKDIAIIQLMTSFREDLPKQKEAICDRHKEITYNACLLREIRAIHLISTLVERKVITDKSFKNIHLHLIRNNELFKNLDLSTTMNTEWSFIEYLFEAGYTSGKSWLMENYDRIGVSSSADIERDFI